MKKFVSILTIAAVLTAVMAACNRKGGDTATQGIRYEDTVGLAQFQAWKAMNERVDPTAPVADNNAVATTPKRTTTKSQSGSMTSTSQNNAQTAKKKGWSKAAKGAVIGGGTGAVLGAVINKRNRVVGGIIGGVIGGGIGYGIGRSKDKKDGRY